MSYNFFLELRARCLDHAIGDSIIAWGFVGIQFFDFSSKFVSCDCFMEQMVYWEDGVFYFMEECTYSRVG